MFWIRYIFLSNCCCYSSQKSQPLGHNCYVNFYDYWVVQLYFCEIHIRTHQRQFGLIYRITRSKSLHWSVLGVSALEKTFTRPEAAVPSPTHIMYWLLIYWSCVYSSWFPKPLLLTKANTVSQLLHEPFSHLFLASDSILMYSRAE
jgi:hypothetical protein